MRATAPSAGTAVFARRDLDARCGRKVRRRRELRAVRETSCVYALCCEVREEFEV